MSRYRQQLQQSFIEFINSNNKKSIEEKIRDFVFRAKKIMFPNDNGKILFNIVKHETENNVSYTLVANKNFKTTIKILLRIFGEPTYYTDKFFIWGDRISADCRLFNTLENKEKILSQYSGT